MTKNTFAKGVSKAVPIVGGVVSGSITLATMRPMGKRLFTTLDEAHFSYSQQDYEKDWNEINTILNNSESDYIDVDFVSLDNSDSCMTQPAETSSFDKLHQAKQLLDDGIITEEEFNEIKRRIIAAI